MGRGHLQLVHVSHEGERGPASGAAASAEQERAAGGRQDTVHPRKVVQHLVEEDQV